MSFLSPIVLGGLAAIGVPILIHYFNKFRVRKTEWGAMRFLLEGVEQSQKKIKLDDLLLLILRCLLVLLAVLAFAQPVLKGFGVVGESSGPVAVVVLLDQSASMEQGNGTVTRFEQAKTEIRSWLDGLDAQSLVGFHLCSTRSQAMIGKPTNDLALFKNSLNEAKVTDFGSDLSQSLRVALDSLKGITGRPKEIRIYTDGQTAAFLKRAEMKQLAEDNPDVVIRPIIVGSPVKNNLGIVGLQAEGSIISIGQPVRLRAEILNSGTSPVSNVRVGFTIDANSPAGSSVISSIQPGETQSVIVTVEFSSGGAHRITASIDADDFPTDNQRITAVDVTTRMDVVLATTSQLSNERDRGVFFLTHALVPVPKNQAANYFLAPRSMSVEDLPQVIAQAEAERPEVIFLCDPSNIREDIGSALDVYVKEGGHLIVFPGIATDPTRWTKETAFGKLLPAALGEMVETPAGASIGWQSGSFTHPVTAFWNDVSNGSLASLKFTRYCPMTLKKSGKPTVIASYHDRSPAAAEWRYGQGHVVLFSSSVSLKWTNQALHPSFVPFISRLIAYFQRDSSARLNIAPGEVFRKPLAKNLKGKNFSILKPHTETARTGGMVTNDDTSTFLRYSATDKLGAYVVSIASEPIATFAVQMPASESNLRGVDPDSLKELSDISRDKAADDKAVPTVVLKEFWTVLIWIFVAFFLIEAVWAHRLSFNRS